MAMSTIKDDPFDLTTLSGAQDSLMQIFTREVLDAHLQSLIDECIRHQQPIALIMFDVDHFKKFNEVGHQTGDEALRAIAGIIKKVIDRRGLVVRYGGDEITAILPNHGRDEAYAVAQRIQLQMQNLRIGPTNLRVTISSGVTASECAISGSDLIYQADMALLRAKKTGRNRIEPSLNSTKPLTDTENPIKLPKIRPLSFNPYDEAENLIAFLKTGLKERCDLAEIQGVSCHISQRGEKTCLRVLLRGNTIYSLNVWLGTLGSDHTLNFYGVAGEMRGNDNAMNATAEVVWDKAINGVAVELFNLSLLRVISDRKRYTPEEFLEALWNVIIEALERE